MKLNIRFFNVVLWSMFLLSKFVALQISDLPVVESTVSNSPWLVLAISMLTIFPIYLLAKNFEQSWTSFLATLLGAVSYGFAVAATEKIWLLPDLSLVLPVLILWGMLILLVSTVSPNLVVKLILLWWLLGLMWATLVLNPLTNVTEFITTVAILTLCLREYRKVYKEGVFTLDNALDFSMEYAPNIFSLRNKNNGGA